MMAILADGSGSPLDQGVTTILLLGAAFLAWIAVARLRGRAYRKLPRRAAWAAAALAVVLVALAFVLTPILRPNVASARPSTTARLAILSPAEGETFSGNPATVPVRLQLTGGRVVAFTSSRLVPDEGHVHLYLDGSLVSMSFALEQTLEVAPGSHVLRAEFVAVDHAPFSPRVMASVEFVVSAPAR
jgi:hypothetical protein